MKRLEAFCLKIKDRLPMLIIFAILVIALSSSFYLSNEIEENKIESVKVPNISYLEDKDGQIRFDEINRGSYDNYFQEIKGNDLSIGQSQSFWWIKIDSKVIDTFELESDEQAYLSIKNPTVKSVMVYVPETIEKTEDKNKDNYTVANENFVYKPMTAGWGVDAQNDEEVYLNPIFKISKNIDMQRDIYIRVNSPFTQNYRIEILGEKDFNLSKLRNLLIMGIFYGILVALSISNLVGFLSFKDNVQLHYVIYIFSILLYNGALLGLFRIFMGSKAETLIGNVVLLGLFMVAAEVLFLRSFLSTEGNHPKQDKIILGLVVLCIIGMLLMALNYKYEASVFSVIPAIGAILITISTSLKAYLNGTKWVRYFLAGWIVMLIGYTVFSARVWGFIPNNDFALYFMLITAVTEALLLSLALAERVKCLREEKEEAIRKVIDANESSLYNETAFLQAQIKPHFLYNALNVIAALCRIDSEKARMLIIDLSNYLHHNFIFGNLNKYISFEEELDLIKAYIRIEQARFPDKIKMIYSIDDIKGLKLPPLMIQPLVENAVRHGIRKSGKGDTIILRIENMDDHFRIEVEDNGGGMTPEQIKYIFEINNINSNNKNNEHISEKRENITNVKKEPRGVGLMNINRRLQMIYKSELAIESIPDKGTKISFKLPIE